MVNTTPPATDSPAEPMVWTMLFSRIVEPPSRFNTEIASTAIGMDALTVSPARRPRYTVEAPKSRPNKMPRTIALNVNSGGDFVAGTYGVNSGGDCVEGAYGAKSAMARDGSIEPCESAEQAKANARTGVRAHDQSTFGLLALPQRARRGRCSDDFIASPRRTVPLECSTNSEGPGVFR